MSKHNFISSSKGVTQGKVYPKEDILGKPKTAKVKKGSMPHLKK